MHLLVICCKCMQNARYTQFIVLFHIASYKLQRLVKIKSKATFTEIRHLYLILIMDIPQC